MTLWLLDSLLIAENEEELLMERSAVGMASTLADLTNIGSEFALRQHIQEATPDETPEHIAVTAERMWRFLDLSLPEDIVAVVCSGGKSLRLAEITGPYYYDSETDGRIRHLKPVRWLSEKAVPLPKIMENYESPDAPLFIEVTDEKQKDAILAPAGLSRSFSLRYIPLIVAAILGIRILLMMIENLRSAGIF